MSFPAFTTTTPPADASISWKMEYSEEGSPVSDVEMDPEAIQAILMSVPKETKNGLRHSASCQKILAHVVRVYVSGLFFSSLMSFAGRRDRNFSHDHRAAVNVMPSRRMSRCLERRQESQDAFGDSRNCERGGQIVSTQRLNAKCIAIQVMLRTFGPCPHCGVSYKH